MKIIKLKPKRPMAFKEFLKAMKIRRAGPDAVKLYLEYVVQHQGLDKYS